MENRVRIPPPPLFLLSKSIVASLARGHSSRCICNILQHLIEARPKLALMIVSWCMVFVACQKPSPGRKQLPVSSQSSPLDRFCRTSTSPVKVCDHLHNLRVKKDPKAKRDDTCLRRMVVSRDLDGPKLWPLRADCISASTTLVEAYRCNRKHHPRWPEPMGIGNCPSLPKNLFEATVKPKPTSGPQALCDAAASGKLQKVKELIKVPKNIESVCDATGTGERDFKDLTALMVASLFGQTHVAKHLVAHGFDPLERNAKGLSSYVLAAMGNHHEIVDFYWSRRSKPAVDDKFIGAILWSAGLWGRKPILEHYLQKGADVNAIHFGYSALAAAAQSGHLQVVKYLIAKGAKLKTPKGLSALEVAQTHKREDVVNYLKSLPAPKR